MKKFIKSNFVLFVLLFVSACVEKESGASDIPFEIKDSKFIVGAIHIQDFYWVDNERVFFVSYDPELKNKPHYAQYALYSWNTKVDQIIRHTEVINDTFCYYKGYVYYQDQKKKGDPVVEYSGNLGEEKSAQHQPAKINKLDCSKFDFPNLKRDQTEGKVYNYYLPLIKGHGKLDLGKDAKSYGQSDYPVKYYPEGKSDPIVLPIMGEEVSTKDIRYYEFLNAYILYSSVPKGRAKYGITHWPADLTRPIYLLSPDGKVKTETIPYSDHIKSSRFYFTKKGIFVADWGITREGIGSAGAYLFTGKKYQKFLSGRIEEVKVSPDGCKVALTNDLMSKGSRRTLKMIDLCIEKGKP